MRVVFSEDDAVVLDADVSILKRKVVSLAIEDEAATRRAFVAMAVLVGVLETALETIYGEAR